MKILMIEFIFIYIKLIIIVNKYIHQNSIKSLILIFNNVFIQILI